MTAPTTVRRNTEHPSLTARTPHRTEDFFDEAQLAELRTYVRPLKKVRLITRLVSMVIDLILVFGVDLGPRIDDGLGDLPWPIRLMLVAAAVIGLNLVLELPVSWWVTMVHDRRHGLSNHTPGLWLADQVKELALTMVLFGALFVPVFWAVRRFDSWWLVGGLLFLLVNLFFAFVYPVLIMPRFNKFTPMPEGALRTRIEEIAELSGVTIEGVYTMDGSKRSRRGNAFVAGFGPTKRVVVYDTMVDKPLEQIAQVVAHEIGHYRLNHIPKSFPLAGFQMLVTLAVVQFLAGNDTVLGWAGLEALGEPGAMPLFLLAFIVPSTVLGLLSSYVSRRNEREADLEALELLGDPTNFVALWPGLVEQNKADLEPGWWDRLNASHPATPERMQFGLDWAEMNGVPATKPAIASVPKPTSETDTDTNRDASDAAAPDVENSTATD